MVGTAFQELCIRPVLCGLLLADFNNNHHGYTDKGVIDIIVNDGTPTNEADYITGIPKI